MEVNLTLFRKIARLTSDQVLKINKSVLEKTVSLKEALALCELENARTKTLILAEQLLGGGEVLRQFMDSFTDQTLDAFQKAQVGPKGNQIGSDLEEYCRKLKNSGNSSVFEPKVQVVLTKDRGPSPKADVMVVTADEPDEASWRTIQGLLQQARKVNPSFGVVLVFENNEGLEDIKEDIQSELKRPPTEVYFLRGNPSVKNSVRRNAFYGLVVGKVFNGPLQIINGNLTDTLKQVVRIMSPPNSRVVVYPMATKVPLVVVHDEETAHVQYVVTENDQKKLNSLMLREPMKENVGVVTLESEKFPKDKENNTVDAESYQGEQLVESSSEKDGEDTEEKDQREKSGESSLEEDGGDTEEKNQGENQLVVSSSEEEKADIEEKDKGEQIPDEKDAEEGKYAEEEEDVEEKGEAGKLDPEQNGAVDD